MKPIRLLNHSSVIKRLLYRLYFALPERFKKSTPIRDALKAEAAKPDASCLYLGANDGVSGNHMHEWIVTKGVPTVMVEPNPNVFGRLKQNYLRTDAVTTVFGAVGDEQGCRWFYFFDHDDGAKPGYDQVGSFSEEWIEQQMAVFGAKDNTRCLVATHTLVQLRKMCPIPPTILVVDCEGYDFSVIQQMLKFDFRPRVLVYEHEYIKEPGRTMCENALAHAGYEITKLAGDTLAILKEAK